MSARLATEGALPKPPNSTFVNARFIAFDMRIERMKPAAPSSAPQMMRTLLPIAKPVALAASPAYEFKSEMMTGMSAPPIGITIDTPMARASAIIVKNTAGVAGAYTR